MANSKRTTKITKTTGTRRRAAPAARRPLVTVRSADEREATVIEAKRSRPARPRRGRSLAGKLATGIQSVAATDAVRRGLRFGAKRAAIDAVITALSLGVVLIGLGILMAALVPGLAGYVEPLWLRMVIAATAYVVVGTILASLFSRRLKRDALGTTGLARWTSAIFRGRYREV